MRAKSWKGFSLLTFLLLCVIIVGCSGGGQQSALPSDGGSPGGNPGGGPILPPTAGVPSVGALTLKAYSDRVDLSWLDTSPSEYGFKITKDGLVVAETDRNIAAWTDVNVAIGDTYCYQIIPYNREYKQGVVSELECVTIPLPPAPINNLPTISALAANPSNVEASEQSSITCQASDPDNDPLTYTWSANAGTISGSGNTVQWTAPASAGNYTIQCSVSDDKGMSDAKSTNVAVTDSPPQPPFPINHSPAISSVSANLASVETGEQASVSCQASDQDNDPISYSWSASGGSISGSGSTVQWTAPAQAGTYTIQCSVSDGRGGSKSGVTDILVTDPIPVQTKWHLSPDLSTRSIATDQATGELYAAGRTTATPTDVFLAKFNPDGTLAWEKRWGTPECDDVANLIIFNSEIFLSWSGDDQYCVGGGTARVSRFDTAGNEIYAFQSPTNSKINAVDGVAIYFKTGAKTDYQGVVLSWQSFPLWVNIMITDASMRDGITYYVGQSQLAADPTKIAESFTAATDGATGNVIWTSRWGAPRSDFPSYSIAVNISGIYTFTNDFMVLHYDFAGNLLWTHQYDAATYGTYCSYTITDDAAIYAMGSNIWNGCGLTKITNDGAVAWQTSVTGRSLALFNNVLFVTDDSNVIHRYDALTGSALP